MTDILLNGTKSAGVIGRKRVRGGVKGGEVWDPGAIARSLLNLLAHTTFCDMEYKITHVDNGLDLVVSHVQLKSKLMEITETMHA